MKKMKRQFRCNHRQIAFASIRHLENCKHQQKHNKSANDSIQFYERMQRTKINSNLYKWKKLTDTKIKSTESQALLLFMEAKQVQKSTFSSLV